MSLNEEQIDAFTIAIEQELTDPDFIGSDYTDLITRAVANLDPASRQEEYLRVATDLALLFSGAVVASAEERQQRERDRIRAEEEAEQARREERRRARDEREQRRGPRTVTYSNEDGSCVCGTPSCTFNVRYANENPGPTVPPLSEWSNYIDPGQRLQVLGGLPEPL